MEICKQKIFFVIKVLLPWEWYKTFNEILNYKSFSLPLFSTTGHWKAWRSLTAKDKSKEN